jgi:hypothetical protein
MPLSWKYPFDVSDIHHQAEWRHIENNFWLHIVTLTNKQSTAVFQGYCEFKPACIMPN